MEKITVNSMQHYLEETWNAFLEQFSEKQMEWPSPFSQKDSVVYCSTPDLQIAEVIYLMQCEGMDGSKIVQMEENIARAVHLRWKDYDIVGEYRW